MLVVGRTHLGRAVLAVAPFRVGNQIIEFKGPCIPRSRLPDAAAGTPDHFMQIGPDLYLGPSGDLDDLINHSCDPNAGLRFRGLRIDLVAIRDIDRGEEITWDYSTTLFNNPWTMRCECRSPVCRQEIGEFSQLPQWLQRRYQALDIIPPYLAACLNSDAELPCPSSELGRP